MIFLIDELREQMRCDAYLSSITDYSRTQIASFCDKGLVTCNGKTLQKKDPLKIGMTVELTPPLVVSSSIVPENIPLSIVYEDEDLLVINKPKGMVVHPAPGNESGTLVNALLYYCKGNLSGIGGVERPGIVHRIDKDTAGLLVVAKNDATHRHLSSQLAYHGVKRTYYALVAGGFKEPKGTIHEPIGRHPVDRKKMAVLKDPHAKSRDAITHYEVLEQFRQVSFVKLELETGRTHQIRVHMSYLGHPLLGDTLYGGGKTTFEKQHPNCFEGQCLFAGALSFVHPRTGEQVSFEVPLPEDFEHLLTLLRNTI